MGLSEKQKKQWLEKGYVVVPNALPLPLLRDVIRSIEDFLGKRMDEPSDWYKDPMYPGGIINMNHHQSFWETRQHPDLHKIFSDVWGTEKLTVSQDRANMNPPANEKWNHGGTIHWDIVSTQQPLPFQVQGLLVLTDTAENQGGFQCVPGFHNHLEEWAKTQPSDRPPRHPNTQGMDIKDIPASAGDFIIWHSALPHGNSKNHSSLPRLCQYITMNPTKKPFTPSVPPLAHTIRSEIARALGVPEGAVENWLRKQHEADMVIVKADSIQPYKIVPNLIRIESDQKVTYVHKSWGQIIDPNSMLISRGHALAVDLQPACDATNTENSIKEAILNIPEPRFEPTLSSNQLAQVPSILIEQRKSSKHIWSTEEIAKLMEKELNIQIRTREVDLTPLGKKLANVNPW